MPYPRPASTSDSRIRCDALRLYRGDAPLSVRGVTYGTFRPDATGHEYPDRIAVEKDFALMATHGIDAVRVYTVPPPWLLDVADQHGLTVMVGIPLERQVGHLADGSRGPDLAAWVRDQIAPVAGHPATLCYSLANEISASTVRWHGARRMERFLSRMAEAARRADPGALLTYANYPTTEYLELPFLDLVSFNVYLEQPDVFEAYVARLQNLAGDRPLLLTEIGLDARRNGEQRQAETLEHQLRSAAALGCAGAFAYAWTDEWHRGGEDVFDWEFGLTRRDRRPKPALGAAQRVFSESPLTDRAGAPRISVVVCSYNGSRTIRECLEGVARIDYPDFEVVVVDDGSTDATAEIAAEFDVRLIRTAQNGLSRARNTGMQAATGEIVAYLDDDAWPDPQWLHYLARIFEETGCWAAGGPNVPPAGDGLVAECVSDAPGNPTHVLLTDREAEHLPGCNLAIRKEHLEAIGGFDPRFRAAGDDVDVCWRLRDRGGSLGFHPAALVWHHRRGSLRTYWSQQVGYGRAEGLLESKWPAKYNGIGHLAWGGRVYAGPRMGRARIYQGVWGSAPFQSIYGPSLAPLSAFALMPEWLLLVVGFAALSLLGVSWPPLFVAAPVAAALAAISVGCAVQHAVRSTGVRAERSRARRAVRVVLTAAMVLMQPLARLRGRIENGLTPWRSRRESRDWASPWSQRAFWAESSRPAEQRLHAIESKLSVRTVTSRGGVFDRHDLAMRGGVLGGARLLLAVEEHGGGCQLLRLRLGPQPSPVALGLTACAGALAVAAGFAGAWVASLALGGFAAGVGWRILVECGIAARDAAEVVAAYARTESLTPIERRRRAAE
jgi:GT2 family glycosyltransferase